MLDIILVLLIIYLMAFFYYGLRAPILGLFSVAITCLTDIICTMLSGKKINTRDFSPIVTGMLIPLMMPATIPYSAVLVAAIVATAIAKHPFGGTGHNVFNPAAAGIAFTTISYGKQMFTYPLPLQKLPVFLLNKNVSEFLLKLPFYSADLNIISGASSAFTLKLGGIPNYSFVDMALGNSPGPMGATNILVILACLLFLIFRNTVRWNLPVSLYSTIAVFALVFPRIDVGWMQSMTYELMSGTVLFGGVLMLSDPVTTPKRDISKVMFGVTAGIVIMLYRHFGNLEDGFAFCVLIMNASVWAFDMLGERIYSILRWRRSNDALKN